MEISIFSLFPSTKFTPIVCRRGREGKNEQKSRKIREKGRKRKKRSLDFLLRLPFRPTKSGQ